MIIVCEKLHLFLKLHAKQLTNIGMHNSIEMSNEDLASFDFTSRVTKNTCSATKLLFFWSLEDKKSTFSLKGNADLGLFLPLRNGFRTNTHSHTHT